MYMSLKYLATCKQFVCLDSKFDLVLWMTLALYTADITMWLYVYPFLDLCLLLQTILEILPGSKCKLVSREKGGVAKVLFPDSQSCKTALQVLSRRKVGEHKLQAQYGHPDSLLFVGNLPLAYTSSELHDLFSSFGEIHRCFIVYSPNSGSSKGYGFVELSCKEEAMAAKQKMATKQVGCRSLRVDFADNGMQTCGDLQSHTLFVDKLPKSLKGEGVLKELFSQYGVVNFCQVCKQLVVRAC